MPLPLLQVKNMSHYFSGLRAVYNYNLEIEPGEVRGPIGPNRTGKTTIFNLIAGVYSPTEGEIYLEGVIFLGLRPHTRYSLHGFGP